MDKLKQQELAINKLYANSRRLRTEVIRKLSQQPYPSSDDVDHFEKELNVQKDVTINLT